MILELPEQALSSYQWLGHPVAIEPITLGQLNKTFLVTTNSQQFIAQELSKVFDTSVIDDAYAVAQHLENKGIVVPKLLYTDQKKLFTIVDNRIFRVLRYIPGNSVRAITSLKMAHAAGNLLGQFHKGLQDFSYTYRSQRKHGGDYSFHKQSLVNALKNHPDHNYFSRIEPLALFMLSTIDDLTHGWSTTKRHAHGDPKISNFIFDDQDQGICLIDFDTLSNTGWSLEVADALRSWCNPYPEDVLDAYVDLSIAEHALTGYAHVMKGAVTAKECDELIKHTQAITLCLAMRYAADTLNEKYFTHDAERFERPCDHTWLKTNAMVALFKDFQQKNQAITDIIAGLLR